ncbi:hypothetical protein [Kutzneria buriramensis]|uniref:Uncharacterized protein n=1 Tax=Kutzneria buriramensis TaxID=1045776 RepID=A0A3E0HET2_9PSEU|nr:hypothetical protein [Kutzneria buriramensis]REH43720.1 hypothetical protein BCF44_109263 [Kutzneria buriramensis]
MGHWGYEYCQVYLRGPVPAVADLPSAPGVAVEPHHNNRRLERLGDDFPNWPTLVDVYADGQEGQQAIVGLVTALLRQMWAAGVPAVAACDFEDELPEPEW